MTGKAKRLRVSLKCQEVILVLPGQFFKNSRELPVYSQLFVEPSLDCQLSSVAKGWIPKIMDQAARAGDPGDTALLFVC